MSATAAGAPTALTAAATTVTGAVPHTGAVRPLSSGANACIHAQWVTAGAGAMAGAAVYGNPVRMSVREDDPTVPTSPYGSSKLTEIMLRDAEAAHGLRYMILRYFNVAGADPLGRTGQSTRGATHLIKVAVETALGLRPMLSVFGTTAPASGITCTCLISLPCIAMRSPICAPAAPRRRSIAVTVTVFPCWK
jgi:hypothetical protein